MSGCSVTAAPTASIVRAGTPCISGSDTSTVRTKRAAARIAGVGATTVGGWVKRGLLPPPPWTPDEILDAAAVARSPRGCAAPHGTTSRWRVGCSCLACTQAHNEEARGRREAGWSTPWDCAGPLLIAALAAGAPYREALQLAGVSSQALSARRRREPLFARDVDAALMAGRDPLLMHGTDGAWRARCRCPDCRRYHDLSRTSRSDK